MKMKRGGDKPTYLLTSWVLELSTPQSFNHLRLVTITRSHRHNWLANIDTGNGSLWFAKSTTHSSLKPV